jgi:phosphoglycerate dehydrogenase-like enzyme
MTSVRVAVLDDYGPWERLAARVQLDSFTDHLDDDDALIERLAPYEVVVAMRERTPFPRARLDRLPNLRLLVTTGPSNVAIDVAAATDHGITVCGTGHHLTATAELTWGLILALTRHIASEDHRIRAGGWQREIGPELEGRTLGLLGLGRLGSRVAGYGAAFGMKLIAWSQNLDRTHATSLGVEAVTKEELLHRADILSVHLRLSERTRGLIGAGELALMRPTAFLVNTSRAPIVDEQALLAALQSGALAGAALDVYEREPLTADDPLREAPNTVLTPHIGYVAEDSYRTYFSEIVQDIEAWLDGAPIRLLSA